MEGHRGQEGINTEVMGGDAEGMEGAQKGTEGCRKSRGADVRSLLRRNPKPLRRKVSITNPVPYALSSGLGLFLPTQSCSISRLCTRSGL